MTPKEKAKELANIYLDITKRSLNIEGWFYDVDIAKQCTLIAVDEILKVAFYATDEIYDYYHEVKQEIEKL
jgi:predicted DNA-binding ArsR family transcriptional regulator